MVKYVHLGTCTCKSPEAGTVSSRVVWNTRETSIGPARGTVELWDILVREWGRGECSAQVGKGISHAFCLWCF